ncbi:hypothetical protein [Butyricicoccus sp.]|uniref:hypothetical protein n=1 Tax=Butyricicoccus sp. TaxID=2049021 RepID=UPI00373567C1
MIDAVRKTCNAGKQTEFKFRTTSVAFRVKNFTNGPVTVCLRSWNDNESIMVGAGIAETIVSNREPSDMMQQATTATVIVTAEQTGTVEVIRDD